VGTLLLMQPEKRGRPGKNCDACIYMLLAGGMMQFNDGWIAASVS
jgi:hypothetical protein